MTNALPEVMFEAGKGRFTGRGPVQAEGNEQRLVIHPNAGADAASEPRGCSATDNAEFSSAGRPERPPQAEDLPHILTEASKM